MNGKTQPKNMIQENFSGIFIQNISTYVYISFWIEINKNFINNNSNTKACKTKFFYEINSLLISISYFFFLFDFFDQLVEQLFLSILPGISAQLQAKTNILWTKIKIWNSFILALNFFDILTWIPMFFFFLYKRTIWVCRSYSYLVWDLDKYNLKKIIVAKRMIIFVCKVTSSKIFLPVKHNQWSIHWVYRHLFDWLNTKLTKNLNK